MHGIRQGHSIVELVLQQSLAFSPWPWRTSASMIALAQSALPSSVHTGAVSFLS